MKKITNAYPQLTAESIKNPFPFTNRDTLPTNPDPFVMKYLGEYYCYSTHVDGVQVLYSRDMQSWEHKGFALQTEGFSGYWAPSVIYANGKFYMYYSSSDDKTFEFMKVAVADNPLGPFEYVKTLYNYFSIDSHVVRGEDGEYYLFYSTDNFSGTEQTRAGTIILVDRLVDMLTPEGKPKLIIYPTIDQEISTPDRLAPGHDWHTIEGALYIRRGGKDYIMYSGNNYEHEDYFVGYTVSTDETKDLPINQKEWVKYPDDYTYAPLLRRNDEVEGTGHNSFVKAPNNVEDWIVYHGRDVGTIKPGEEKRVMRGDRIFWDNGAMWLAGPSNTCQDAPSKPAVYDFFDGDLEGNWSAKSGIWSANGGVLEQNDQQNTAAIACKKAFSSFIFEVSARVDFYHFGNCYGIYADYSDAANNTVIYIKPGRGRAEVIRLENGVETLVCAAAIDADFNPFVWHTFTLTKTVGAYSFAVDGLKCLEFKGSRDAVCVGMAAVMSKAQFCAASVTKVASSLNGDISSLFKGKSEHGVWKAEENGLKYYTSSRKAEGEIEYLPVIGENFTINFDIIPRASSDKFKLGFAADGNMVVIDGKTGNITTADGTVPLPEGFDMRAPHSVHIRRAGERICVIADRCCVYDGKASGEPRLVISADDNVLVKDIEIIE